MRRTYGFLLLLLFVVCSFSTPSEASSRRGLSSRPTVDENGAEYAEGEVLVRLSPGASAMSAQSFAASKGVTLATSYEALSSASGKTVLHLVSDSKTTARMIQELSVDPRVELVEPNSIRRISRMPDDPRFGDLWGLRNTGQSDKLGNPGTAGADIDATMAWDTRTNASSVVVAVLDTGVHSDHEDLAANMWDGAALGFPHHGWNCVDGNDTPYDVNGHGSHCAGTIGAVGNNVRGVTGVAWNVRIMAVKVMNNSGSGKESQALDGYNWVLARKKEGVNVVAINASFGGTKQSVIEQSAIEALGDAGILFVAAAGNSCTDNDTSPHYPSSYPLATIIAVAASDRNDAKAKFSNYGATSVHLAAPGAEILSTVPENTDTRNALYDDMESGSAKWTEGSWTWNSETDEGIFTPGRTSWEINEDASYSPVRSWTSKPPSKKGTYHGIAGTENIDLSAHVDTACVLSFHARFSISASNWMDIYFSKDGGATWRFIKGMNEVSSGDNWELRTVLIPREFLTNEFRVGFGLDIRAASPADFIRIDDVSTDFRSATGSAYGEKSGTSMATPHVAGAVGLVAARFPGDTVQQRRARILNSVDRLAAWNGVVSTGGRLNLARAIGPASSGGSGCTVGGVSFHPSILLLLAPAGLLLCWRKRR